MSAEDASELTATIIRWCAELRWEALPGTVQEVAQDCILDWTGVAVAGAAGPVVDILVAEVEATVAGPCTLLARSTRAGVVASALVNGTAGHALDYDDVHLALPGHASAPVLPALLAVAEDSDISGRDFLRAAVCGVETTLRLGRLVRPEHYARGWHSTATMGTVGAAVAAAEALGANDTQRRHAIGLAVSQAAGLKSMFGTQTKAVQVGKAAANGALAARLAMRGLTSNPAALEDPQGLLPVYGGWTGSVSADDPDHFELPDTLFKYHASCYLTHAGIDAAREHHAVGLDPGEVLKVQIACPPPNLSVCDIRRPRTGLESQFSMAATCAMGLVGLDTSRPTAFSTQMLADARVDGLIGRTDIEADDRLDDTQMRVTVTMRDGSTRTIEADTTPTSLDLPAQRKRLESKFYELTKPVLGEQRTNAVVQLVHDLAEAQSVRELTSLLSMRSG